jgi:hypothetical protein
LGHADEKGQFFFLDIVVDNLVPANDVASGSDRLAKVLGLRMNVERIGSPGSRNRFGFANECRTDWVARWPE